MVGVVAVAAPAAESEAATAAMVAVVGMKAGAGVAPCQAAIQAAEGSVVQQATAVGRTAARWCSPRRQAERRQSWQRAGW